MLDSPKMPARGLPDGSAVERDLDVVLHLLDPTTFELAGPWKNSRPPWTASRDVAVVALCWIVGLRPVQIEFERRREWRLEGHDFLIPRVGPKYAGVRDRKRPVLSQLPSNARRHARKLHRRRKLAGPLRT